MQNPHLRSSINLTKILKSFTLIDATQSDLDEMDIVLEEHKITMKDVYNFTSLDCDEILQRCKWEGKIQPCNELFKKEIGVMSYCCSFNYRLPKMEP